MRRRNGEIQVYSISFLDITFCALGGVLIITMQALSLANQKVLLVHRRSTNSTP